MTAPSTIGPFLRATVLTPNRAVDVVLPTDQPIAALVPSLVDLLELPAGGWGHHLSRIDGSVLPAASTLAGSGLSDGATLRLLDAEQSPPDPVVYDLVDAVEEDRPDAVWSERTRRVGLHLVAAALLLAAAVTAVLNGSVDLSVALVAVAGLALASGAAGALTGERGVTWVWFGLAWLAGGLAAATTDHWPWWVSVLVGVPVVLLTVGVAAGRPRAVVTALAVSGVLAATAALTWVLSDDLARTAAVVAATSGLLVGLAPRLALASTGAFALDGRLASGAHVRTRRVGAVVADAHFSLLAAVVVCGLVGAVAGYLAAVRGAGNWWLFAVVAVLTVAWIVRVRHFPLLLERLALAVAALGGAVGLARALVVRQPDAGWPLVLALVAAAAAVAVLGAKPPAELFAANVRRWASRLEALAVVAVVPLLVGAFGVYSDLLDTF